MKKLHPLVKTLKKYCHDVLEDRPLSCVKHKWSIKRFLNDLERQGTEDFPYVFLPEKAERFYEWCSLFKHTKGVLKGKYINLYDTPILLFIFGNVYGWYHKDTGLRRFDKLYWQVARKNAKSQMLSLVATYELMGFDEDGDEVKEIYCAATKTEQARVVYDEAKIILRRCPDLQPYYKVSYGRIVHIRSDSFMRALSKEDSHSGDGLHVQCGIIDEYHAHKTSEIYDVVEDGMAAREQPLLAIITTAGPNLNHPCYRVEYQLITKILDPNIPFDMENYFVMVNELDKDERGEVIDNVQDPKVWIKANPIVCTYQQGIERIKKKLKEALEEPEKMRNFLTKRMNIWIHLTAVSYVSSERWAKCKVDQLPDLQERNVYIGLDFASKIDLASLTFELPIDDKYLVLSHSFMPSETFERKKKTDKVPYDLWEQQGWLTVMDGPIIDYRKAIAYAREQIELYNWFVAEWCLDPWCAGQIMSWLIEEGEEVVEIRQGPRTLSEPTKDFRDMILVERVIHDGNPVLAWAISNAVVDEVDRNKNIVLNKSKSTERIDPIAATVNSHVRAMHSQLGTDPQIFVV